MGNHENAEATMEMMDRQGRTYQHPRADIAEARRLKEIGEVAYMRQPLDDAVTSMKENPAEFLNWILLLLAGTGM